MYYRTDLILGCCGQRIRRGQDGLAIFVRTIPYNFFSRSLTIVMMVGMVLMKPEFGAMRTHEEINALETEIFIQHLQDCAENATDDETPNPRGKVIDLVIPIAVLVICCVSCMIYIGEDFHSGTDFVIRLSQSDASTGLANGKCFLTCVCGSFSTWSRRVINFRDCMAPYPDGFQSHGAGYTILTLHGR